MQKAQTQITYRKRCNTRSRICPLNRLNTVKDYTLNQSDKS